MVTARNEGVEGDAVRTSTVETDAAVADRLIGAEIAALEKLRAGIGAAFSDAVNAIVGCSGHVIVSGVGKSGHIGQKFASSLASTGTPSFFVHPAEASHGDLGMLTRNSVVVAISYSGESRELADLLRYCGAEGITVIGITRSETSSLGRSSGVVLQLPIVAEACPNGLAPTSSTTMTLALCDALTVAVMTRRGFTEEDFGYRHPGGKLGRSLQTVADYLFHKPTSDVPKVSTGAHPREVVAAISAGRAGCVAVEDGLGQFVGMITDGDLRRFMADKGFVGAAKDIMTADPVTFRGDDRMSKVIHELTERRISNAFVLSEGKPAGVIHIKDLLVEGYL